MSISRALSSAGRPRFAFPNLVCNCYAQTSLDQPLRLLSHGTKPQSLWLARNHISGSAYSGDGVSRITQMSDFSSFKKNIRCGASRSKLCFRSVALTGGIGLTVAGSVYDLQKRPYDMRIELGP